MVYQFGRGLVELDYSVYDKVELEFTFREPAGKEGAVPEAIWAIVAKDEMKQIRLDRWDMVRLAILLAHHNTKPMLTSSCADLHQND